MAVLWDVLVKVDKLANWLTGGHHDETISSRAAKAQQRGRPWGCVLCRVLDVFDKDHCAKSLACTVGKPCAEEEGTSNG